MKCSICGEEHPIHAMRELHTGAQTPLYQCLKCEKQGYKDCYTRRTIMLNKWKHKEGRR